MRRREFAMLVVAAVVLRPRAKETATFFEEIARRGGHGQFHHAARFSFSRIEMALLSSTLRTDARHGLGTSE